MWDVFPMMDWNGMASLRDLCAIVLMRHNVDINEHPAPEDYIVSRCACDEYEEYFMNDYKTKEFIQRLPLPVTVKEYLNEVAQKFCDRDHDTGGPVEFVEVEGGREEDDFSDFSLEETEEETLLFYQKLNQSCHRSTLF